MAAIANIAETRAFTGMLSIRKFSDESSGQDRQPYQRRDGGQGGFGGRSRPPPPTTPTKVLYVGNVSFQTTEEELMELFSQVGAVDSVKLARHAADGNPRG